MRETFNFETVSTKLFPAANRLKERLNENSGYSDDEQRRLVVQVCSADSQPNRRQYLIPIT